ncbi:MAG: hypothetical protein AAF799_00435 [Myxococcota bacterium]
MSLSLLLGACPADDDPSPTAAASSSSGDPDSSGGDVVETTTTGGEGLDSTGPGIDVDALYGCEDPDFTVFQPLTGPGIDPETGMLLEPIHDSYLLHTTQIMARPEAMAEFFAANESVLAQLGQTEGLVGFSIAIEPNCGFARTLGIWEDERSMLLFIGTGAHLDAMTEVADLAVTARSTTWTANGADMPLTWAVALEAIADITPIVY